MIGCKDKKGNGFPVGYVEIGGKLYKLEPSRSNKEGVEVWIRCTQMQRRSGGNSFGGGRRERGGF
ncbi:MAG TPA: hypothetical protein VGE02_09445 [Gemmatimonadales bacterium]